VWVLHEPIDPSIQPDTAQPDTAAIADVPPAPVEAPAARPYAFRPAEFTPATFNPAESPYGHPVVVAAPAVPVRSKWSTGLARAGEELVAWFKTLVSAAVYATLIVTFGFQVARVEGQSMVPTLEDQDRLIVNKLAYRLHAPQVGDIVMLYYPEDPDKSFVKRIIGEEDDTLRSVNGRVFRNDVPFPDDFIPEQYRSAGDTWGPEIVRRGQYFVMGDHRNNSSDSRTWGQVPKRYIIGKVQIRWWPLNHARIF
jgi:signal peptidase I